MVKKINEFKELQKKKGKKGFSMIELIIVLAIMAILVALIGTQLIPYLEKSREKRDMTTLDTCKTAFESVVADYELSMSNGSHSISDLGTGVSDFYKYAGLNENSTPFKSDKSKTGGNDSKLANVQFEYKDNVLTKVTVGTISVSSNASKSS